MRFFNWVQGVIVGLSGVVAEVTGENRLAVDTKPATDNAAVSAYGLPKVSFEGVQKAIKWSEATLQINFVETQTGSGAMSIAAPNVLVTNSGAATSSSIAYRSKQPIRQSVTKGLLFRNPLIFPDAGVAGNVREIGLYNPASQNGWLLRLNGTAFQFVVFNNGVETINSDSSTWDVPFTLDTNLHLYEIQTKSVASGDFDIFIDKILVHTIKNLGVAAGPLSSSTDNPIWIRNENTTNATDVRMNIAPTSILNEGEEQVIVSDGTRNILLNSSRRVLVQGAGSPLMGEKFATPLDTVNRWDPTVVGAAAWTQPVDTYTLFLSTTTAATDFVELSFRENNLEETTGGFAEFEVGAKFGDTLEPGNIREWGYEDSTGLNGVFFRVNGTSLEFVNLKGGVEAITSLADSLPNLNFHLYRIEHLGAGKIAGYIDGNQVVDFAPAAVSQVGAAEKKPFVRMYNNAVLAGTPTDSEFHWIRLLDQSGTRTTIVGIDDNNIFRQVRVNTSGRLLVSQEPPTPPAATTPVDIREKGTISGTVDTLYTITNGTTLTIQRLSGGAETSNAGHVIELYDDPNGDLSVLNIIDDIYVNGASDQKDLLGDFIGDGIRRILLRRRAFGGGTNEVTGIWQGYET
jgi:hypothetical protein